MVNNKTNRNPRTNDRQAKRLAATRKNRVEVKYGRLSQ